jgi:transposase InsO family protein
MREWYSAAELAGLPGLPGTARRISARAQRDHWQHRPRRARGGGREYHISALPRETRAHLAAQAGGSIDAETLEAVTGDRDARARRRRAKQDGLRRLAAMRPDDPRKLRAHAREWVLRRWADYAQVYGTGTAGCVHEFVAAYCGGEIEIPGIHAAHLPVRHGARSLDRATLYRWQQAYRDRGLAGLLDGYGQSRGRSKIAETPALRDVVLACIQQQPHITPSKIKDYLAAEHPDLDIVSAKSIERYLAGWKREHAQLWTYTTNPDRWKNAYLPAYGSHHEHIERLNQLWEMDSTPADWMLVDGRHVVVGVIDLYSRRLRLRVSKTSRAEAVALTARDALLAWGVPEAVRTDNGKDYTSAQFRRVLEDLEVEQLLCLPFASEEKGTIERALQTVTHGLLDLLPGFIGHSVADRKVIEARKSFAQRVMEPGAVVDVQLTATELQAKLDDWCEHVYARDAHAGLSGRSPFAVATAWTGEVHRIEDERALDALLCEVAGVRTVTKKGIRYEHHDYVAPELVEHTGREVQLRRDADDIGRLYVYDLQGQYLCMAQAHALLGISRQEVAAVAKAHARGWLADQKAELRAAKQAVKRNIAEAVLEHRIAEAEKVTALPSRATPYSTPALEQHGIAARASDAPQGADIDTGRHAEFVATFDPTPTPIEQHDPRRIYARWMRIAQRIERGAPVSEADRLGLERYRQTPEHASMRDFFTDFADQISIDEFG